MDVGASTGAMPSFWQVAAALVAVLGLLVLALKALRRLQPHGAGDHARLLQVRRLGPKRDLEVLRVDDEVYTIYRHDGGLVLLRREACARWDARQAGSPGGARGACPRSASARPGRGRGPQRGPTGRLTRRWPESGRLSAARSVSPGGLRVWRRHGAVRRPAAVARALR